MKTVFLHIPKTAGTSIIELMNSWFPPSSICPVVFGGELRNMQEDRRQSYDVFAGHFDYALLTSLFPDVRIFTFLRRPQDRIVSVYKYWVAHPWEWLDSVPVEHTRHVRFAKKNTLLETLRTKDPAVLGNIENAYVRTFLPAGCINADGTFKISRAQALHYAIQNAEQLLYVGLLDDLPRSINILASRLGKERPLVVPHKNTSADGFARPDRSEIGGDDNKAEVIMTSELETQLSLACDLDIKFYEHFRQKYQTIVNGHAHDVSRYKGTKFFLDLLPGATKNSHLEQSPSLSPLVFRGESAAEWLSFEAENPWISSKAARDIMVSRMQEIGSYPVEPEFSVSRLIPNIEKLNFRDGLLMCGLNSRERALLLSYLINKNGALSFCDTRVYAPEYVTRLGRYLRATFQNFIGTEYFSGGASSLPNVRHGDIQDLPFESGSFDVVFTNDVLEHVGDIDLAARECCRILSDEGLFISVFPFFYRRDVGERRARLEGDHVIYLMEPVYHGDPISEDGRTLVFEIPGWDIVARFKAFFRQVWIECYSSPDFAVLGGTDVNGVFVVVGRK